ncbi:MAG: dihydrofolate reductase [Chitinophagales bacterium]
MIISLIVAAAENNVIGMEGKLPWHLPADMKYFKQTTAGHVVIMGRGTYDSLGKPLPGRTNIVITRQQNYNALGCVVVGNLKAAIDHAVEKGEQEAFIIGGGDIFIQSVLWADRIYLTRIFHSFEGDTFFPTLNEEDWKMVHEQRHQADEKNRYAFAFQVFERQQH